jgi:D-serine deaminase-like pyridoxal phosphate-dependent protein
VVDSGALSLSKDLGPAHLGLEPVYGEVKGHPELVVASVSQEHGVIRAVAPAAIEGKFKVGDQIEIIPNHSCLTEAHFDEYVVVENDQIIDRWRIERGR